jgi:hypothetical protein
MHDHEELWRECDKQFIYLDCADRVLTYLASQSSTDTPRYPEGDPRNDTL